MNFEQVIAILAGAGVEFVVIGGVAMSAHGLARATVDLDVCYARSQENIRRLARTLAPYHPRLRGAPDGLPFSFDEKTIAAGLNFTLITDLGDVYVLGEVAGIGMYPAVFATSQEVEQPAGTKWRVLTLDGLIRSKRVAGRRRDLDVIPELEALRELPPGLEKKE